MVSIAELRIAAQPSGRLSYWSEEGDVKAWYLRRGQLPWGAIFPDHRVRRGGCETLPCGNNQSTRQDRLRNNPA